jgi:glycerol-3-phosphate dehydrogenase (NAD+)
MIGSGNMGTTIAKLVAENIANFPDFDPFVQMYTFDEQIDFKGKKTSIVEVINQFHENPKYLPGIQLPSTVIAVSDVGQAVKGSDFLIICIPHQFLGKTLNQMTGKLSPNATAISLIKSIYISEEKIELVSDFISERLHIECGALMDASIAHEIAIGQFCESTIAFEDENIAKLWHPLFHKRSFRVKVLNDIVLQSICGTF